MKGQVYLDLYSYCGNSVINYSDYLGRAFFTALLIGFAVGTIISGICTIVENTKNETPWYEGLAISMLAGGVGGAISCISIPGVSTWVCATVFGAIGNTVTNIILGEIKSIEDLMSAITAGAIAGYIGDRSAELLIKGVTKYFGTLTKAKQKAFLNSIGRITNTQLRAIRQEAKRGLTPKILGDLVEKYGYNVVVSAWVSSSLTSLS